MLTAEEMEIAFEDAINGQPMSNTADALNFPNRMAFHRYLVKHPEFAKALQSARLAGNDFIEDEIRHVTSIETDAKLARVKLEALCKLLSFRDPTKYGNRVDINLHQTADIATELVRLQSRLDSTYRDVTPQITSEINELW